MDRRRAKIAPVEEVFCSFCGIGNRAPKVVVFIAAPHNIFICDNCVEICRDMVGRKRLEDEDRVLGIKRKSK